MPRKSVEAMAGELWRTGPEPPAPPAHLDREARAIWRDIVASRSPSYFDPAARILLESFCGLTVAARAAMKRLQAAEPASREAKLATGVVVKLTLAMCTLAVKLRLTPSSRWRADSGRLDESGLPEDRDGLLGGLAARPTRKPN